MDTKGQYIGMTEAEYNSRNQLLHNKLQANIPLTQEEKYFLCDHCRTNLLLVYPICHDEFYIRFFLEYYSPSKFDNFEERHEIYFKSMVKEWGVIMQKTDSSDQLIKLVSEEVRKELKVHKRQNSILNLEFNMQQYLDERFDILSWSKYRYLLIKRTIFTEFPSGKFHLSLNKQKIVYDYYSLVHIVTRHFGETMKPYSQGKDHFHEVFYYDDLHVKLKQIFEAIEQSGLYAAQSLKEINFRYYGTIYKVFCDSHVFQHKGIPDEVALRLNSFFPVGNKAMLDRLANNFIEQKVSDILSVFINK